ncbi:zinc ribbon domain-containing protein [Nocardiopsis algeriensis]|uniref:zinc ribbon domain-containing protein n=1 Tax=Nocardiopsis algeriensis TaxID=1478215 RepID=UPI003B4340F3
MKAESAAQARLLDLQGLDTELQRLGHKAKTLPEAAEAAELKKRLDRLESELIAAQTRVGDAERRQRKAEADVDQVRARADRNTKRMESGQITSAKDLQSLQSEIASLGRRQAELEEAVLEAMEHTEEAAAELARLKAEREEVLSGHTAAVARRDTAAAEIQWDRERVTRDRERVAQEIPEGLLAFYEKLRDQYDGVAVAPLRYGRCEGCKLALSTVELNEVRAAAEDEVVRCENCRRIMVRTAESGLAAKAEQ